MKRTTCEHCYGPVPAGEAFCSARCRLAHRGTLGAEDAGRSWADVVKSCDRPAWRASHTGLLPHDHFAVERIRKGSESI